MKLRFRISGILWATSLYGNAFAIYSPFVAVLVASIVIAYWQIVIRWYEDEHQLEHALFAMFSILGMFELAYLDQPSGARGVVLVVFGVLCLLPLWRSREPWYDKYL